MRSEQWKDIPQYEGIYQVSDKGRVRSLDRVCKYKDGRVRIHVGRIIKQVIDACGYQTVMLSVNRKYKHFKTHRLVAIAFIPNPKNLPEVNHIDGVKTNNQRVNLEWVTSSQNKRHAAKIGLTHPARNLSFCSGEKHHNAKTMIVYKNGVEVKRYTPICTAQQDGFCLGTLWKQMHKGRLYKGFTVKIVDNETRGK